MKFGEALVWGEAHKPTSSMGVLSPENVSNMTLKSLTLVRFDSYQELNTRRLQSVFGDKIVNEYHIPHGVLAVCLSSLFRPLAHR